MPREGTGRRGQWGVSMPDILRKFLLAALIAGGVAPAWGAGMPEYGTKNFSPGADAPSYFTNENGVLGVAADFATDQHAAAPAPAVRAESEPRRAAHPTGHGHGKSAAGRNGTRRVASSAHAHGRPLPTASAHQHSRPLQTAQGHGRGGSSHLASAKRGGSAAASRSAAAAGRGARTAKSGGAKPAGKAGVRHAAARPTSRKG